MHSIDMGRTLSFARSMAEAVAATDYTCAAV